jgi:hypothetical protein
MQLPKSFITNFANFLKVFLARYANFQAPQKSCDSLFELIQGRNEKIRAYMNHFIKVS